MHSDNGERRSHTFVLCRRLAGYSQDHNSVSVSVYTDSGHSLQVRARFILGWSPVVSLKLNYGKHVVRE